MGAPQLHRPLGTQSPTNRHTIHMSWCVPICRDQSRGLWIKPWACHKVNRLAPRPTTMDRWRLSGASGASEVLNDAASMAEVGSMPSGPWQSRWSERRQWTGADARRWWERRLSPLIHFCDSWKWNRPQVLMKFAIRYTPLQPLHPITVHPITQRSTVSDRHSTTPRTPRALGVMT